MRLNRRMLWVVSLSAIALLLSPRGARAQIRFKPAATYGARYADYGTAVDLDRDGNLDIVGADQSNGVFILYGKGDGTFEPALLLTVTPSIYEVAIADFNNDGRLDIAAGCINNAAIGVLLATGPRTFAPRYFLGVGDSPYGVTAGDLNEDGWPDLVVSNAGSHTVGVLLNKADGTGAFQPQVTYAFSQVNHSAIADLNRDGHVDIVASGYEGNLNVYTGDGSGAFVQTAALKTDNGAIGALSGDFNNDGWPDVATANYWSGTTTIFLNDGTGKLLPLVPVNAGGYPHILRAADIDGDGLLDLVIPNAGSPSFNVQRNLGGGKMDNPIFVTGPGIDSRAIAVGDFNGDGRIDVAVSDPPKWAVYVHLNESDIPLLQSVTLSPASVVGGQQSLGTVTLSLPAPAGGRSVGLTSSSAAMSVPATVTIPSGAISATFNVTTQIVAAIISTKITAVGPNSVSATLTVNPAGLKSLTLTPTSVAGGNSAQGRVTLTGGSPQGGYTLVLASNKPTATVPASVLVAEGETTATFPVTTVPVTSSTTVSVSAKLNGVTKTASLNVKPPAPLSVSLSPKSVVGGNSATGIVTLNGPSPLGGTTVALGSSASQVTVAPSVFIPEGSTDVSFPIQTTNTSTGLAATISAAANGVSRTASLSVLTMLKSVSINPASIVGGKTSTGAVFLNAAAPAGGVVVDLSTTNSAASVPLTVTVVEGATAAVFTVSTTPVSSNFTGTVSATSLGATKSSSLLTVKPPALSGLSFSPSTIVVGAVSTAKLTLNGPAPSGFTVSLASSDTNAAPVPASFTFPAGATSATFTVRGGVVAATTAVTITAKDPALVTKAAILTVKP